VGNHAVGDSAAGKTFGFGTAQNAKDVVLSARKASRFKKLFGFLDECVSGPEKRDENAVLEGDGGRFGARIHTATIVVITMIVKRKDYISWRSPDLGLSQRPEVNLAEETLGPLGDDGCDGMGYIFRAQYFGRILGAAPGEIRGDTSRANHTDTDAVSAQILGHAAGKADNTPLEAQ